MVQRGLSSLRVVPPPSRQPILANGVLAMLIFVMTEAMLFAGLISAFTIVRGATPGPWPPAGQPRLPVEETAFNTAALLLSGLLLYAAGRAFKRDPRSANTLLLLSMGLGAFFVVFQGLEWLALLRVGLTLTSSPHGSFFYLIVGLHALHAVAGLALLTFAYARLLQRRLPGSTLATAQVFWFFVVGLWPILYVRVYL